MSVTSVDIDEAFTKVATIKSLLEKQIEIINGYKNSITQFDGTWSGVGHEAFVNSFSQLNSKTVNHFENMQNYNSQIKTLLQKLREADNESASLFRSV